MIPVRQREMFDAADGTRGDCLKCCLASILELPYEDVPHFAALGDGWFTETMNWLAERNLRLLTVWTGAPGEHSKPALVPTDGYWLAGVVSRRVEHECGACSPADPGFMVDGRLCTFCRGWGKRKGGHVVVMKGHEVAWDPHPLREQGHGGFIEAQVLVPLDPARDARLLDTTVTALRMVEENREGESWCAGVAMSALASLDEQKAVA